jgi:hypothetical protein
VRRVALLRWRRAFVGRSMSHGDSWLAGGVDGDAVPLLLVRLLPPDASLRGPRLPGFRSRLRFEWG